MCELALSGEGIIKDPKTSKEKTIRDGQASDLLAPCFQPRRELRSDATARASISKRHLRKKMVDRVDKEIVWEARMDPSARLICSRRNDETARSFTKIKTCGVARIYICRSK